MDDNFEQEKLAKLSIILIMFELQKIIDRFPPISSSEEGLQFIQQKVDELLLITSSTNDDENGSKARLNVAKGVAATAMRFMMEVCLKKSKHGNESNNGSADQPGSTGAGKA